VASLDRKKPLRAVRGEGGKGKKKKKISNPTARSGVLKKGKKPARSLGKRKKDAVEQREKGGRKDRPY